MSNLHKPACLIFHPSIKVHLYTNPPKFNSSKFISSSPFGIVLWSFPHHLSSIPSFPPTTDGLICTLSWFPWHFSSVQLGLPTKPIWCNGKEPSCQPKRGKRLGFDPWVGKILWRREWPSSPVFLPGKCHGQRGLVGYSPRDPRVRHNRLTEQAHTKATTLVKCIWYEAIRKGSHIASKFFWIRNL